MLLKSTGLLSLKLIICVIQDVLWNVYITFRYEWTPQYKTHILNYLHICKYSYSQNN